MKILLININIHPKNLFSLLKYNHFFHIINHPDIHDIDLKQFDVVYSPSQPIDVKNYPNTKFLFGPHFSVFPEKHQMDIIRGDNAIYIHPSDWARDVWKNNPLCNKIRIEALPFGVDINKFNDIKPIRERSKVFIYFKRRIPDELTLIYNFLKIHGYDPIIFDYVTRYNEDEYIEYLKNSKFGVWLDAHESQGFALQEALACNVPLLVWNVISMNQEHGSNYENIPASTIPYWDNNCGEYFTNAEELPDKYNKFIQNIDIYKPRQFIVDSLSIKKCDERFTNLIKTI
jgi:hypothetical protein